MNGLWSPFPAEAAAVLAVDVLVQLTLVTLAALLIAGTVARRHPAARYAVLLGALFCALASPALASVPERPADLPGGGLPNTCVSQLVTLLALIWATGAIARFARFAGGWRQAARLRREARPLARDACDEALAGVAKVLGVARLPGVSVSPSVRGPVALGPAAPLVVLPEALVRTLSPAQLRDVLVHECAHVSQRHHLILLLQQLAAALFWPHPLVHLLNRELSSAREDVCDNFALRATPAVAYARTLLAVAAGVGRVDGWKDGGMEERAPLGASPSARPPLHPSILRLFCSPRPPALEARVLALVDPRRQAATRLGPLATALLATLLLASAITGAGIRAGEAAVLNRPAMQRSAR